MPAPALCSGDAHVWVVGLDQGGEAARELLNAQERERADRYRFPEDARRYAVSRAALRAILALYLGRPPRELVFSYGANGKPALESAPLPLRFNLSHSGGRAVVAVGLDNELGVDIELVRPVPDAAQMVERYFSPAARGAFARLAAHERDEGFLRLWTRQEAYLKARGDGLSGPLDETPDAHWQIRDFVPTPGYLGALALRGRLAALRRFDWND